ncbi:MAG: T9SS type A sorting domain-containing protein [Chloroflexi bacterium]|nr:MAG: T9SS type A sorting domain-containing protein [Chloroflexota bacterium]
MYVGGDFTSLGPTFLLRNGAAAFSTSTGALTSWDPNVQGTVYALAINGSTIYLGGSFFQVGNSSRNNLAAVNNTSGNTTTWNPNIGDIVLALAMNGTNVLAGGDFLTAGAQARLHLASIDASANVLAWDPGTDNEVNCLAMNGTRVYAGGSFNAVGGVLRRNLAALNLVTGLPTAWNPSPDQPVDALAAGSDGTSLAVYVGGRFSSIGGATRPKLARVGLGAGLASTMWNANCDGNVSSLAISNGTLYVGGAFSHLGGASRAFLGAVGLTNGAATAWAPQCNGVVNAIVPTSGGVFAGGAFTSPRLRVAEYDASGGLMSWTANADNVVYALGIMGNTLYLGGDFRNVGGQPRSRLAAVSTLTGALKTWNPGADSTVRAMSTTRGYLTIGGSFGTVAGQVRGGAAALYGADGSGNLIDWSPAVVGDVKTLLLYGSLTALGGSFASVRGLSRAFLALVGATAGTVDVPSVRSINAFFLGPVTPNPVRSMARVRFTLERPARVSLALFDLAGRRVSRPMNDALLAAGEHEAAISSAGLEPGVYFLRFKADARTATRGVTIVR